MEAIPTQIVYRGTLKETLWKNWRKDTTTGSTWLAAFGLNVCCVNATKYRSLAIAHDVEEVFWHEVEVPVKRGKKTTGETNWMASQVSLTDAGLNELIQVKIKEMTLLSIMQQSSKAQDRTLGVWFQNIQQGQVKLPRLQRYEAWDKWRITSFKSMVINK